MAIHKQQRIAMALIVLAGLLGGGAVLMTERAKTGGEEAHAEAEHDEKEHDEKGHDEKNHDDEKDAHRREVRLTDEQLKAAGIVLQAAGPGRLQRAAPFAGEIRFDEDRTTHVVPRVAGVAEAVNVQLGQVVRAGQVLAVVASTALAEQRSELLVAQQRLDAARATHEREKKLRDDRISAEQDYQQAHTAWQEAEIAVRSATQKLAAVGASATSSGLNRFEVRAPFAGTVVEKHLSLGEAVKEDASIFTVSDLGSVWAEFAVAPKDLEAVRVGQRVVVSSTAFDSRVEGRIAYVGALIGEQTRTARARVTLTNPKGAWRPGLFVTVSVLGDDEAVPLAVSAEALQTLGDETVVFTAVPGGFIATPVKTGRSDGHTVEVLAGLKAGDKVASSKTFLLKSELGKAGAEHGH